MANPAPAPTPGVTDPSVQSSTLDRRSPRTVARPTTGHCDPIPNNSSPTQTSIHTHDQDHDPLDYSTVLGPWHDRPLDTVTQHRSTPHHLKHTHTHDHDHDPLDYSAVLGPWHDRLLDIVTQYRTTPHRLKHAHTHTHIANWHSECDHVSGTSAQSGYTVPFNTAIDICHV